MIKTLQSKDIFQTLLCLVRKVWGLNHSWIYLASFPGVGTRLESTHLQFIPGSLCVNKTENTALPFWLPLHHVGNIEGSTWSPEEQIPSHFCHSNSQGYLVARVWLRQTRPYSPLSTIKSSTTFRLQTNEGLPHTFHRLICLLRRFLLQGKSNSDGSACCQFSAANFQLPNF